MVPLRPTLGGREKVRTRCVSGFTSFALFGGKMVNADCEEEESVELELSSQRHWAPKRRGARICRIFMFPSEPVDSSAQATFSLHMGDS